MSDETIMMEDGLQLSYLGKNANISDVIPTGHGLLASYVILRTSNIQQTNKQTNKQTGCIMLLTSVGETPQR